MENQNLIEAYRPILDYNLLGYTYYKIFINLNEKNKEGLSKMKKYLKMNPAVIYIVEGIGLLADLDIEVVVKSNQELFNFIDELRFNFPRLVGDYIQITYLSTLKVKYLPSKYN